MMPLRVFAALFIGLCVGVAFHQSVAYEQQVAKIGEPLKKRRGRETVIWISPLYLPCLFVTLFTALAVIRGHGIAADLIQEFLLELMVTLLVYYAALFCLLPLFRKIFSARACATLWLLPVYLYWMRNIWINNPIKPLLILRIPREIMENLVIFWSIGAVVTAIWKVLSHLLFRKSLLKYAKEVGINEISRLWEREQERIERKKPIPLLISGEIASPLTIGVFGWSMRTVLPDKPYTPEELELIFRHELRHVQRRDVDTKILLAFFEVICWFNPFMWLASRQAVADMELSCDEMVVYGKNEQERKRYASLLLDTAGNDRGFSTCLSASARTLRHRLKNVVQQRKRLSGTVFLAAITAALVMTSGLVLVTADYGTMDEVVLQSAEIGELSRVTAKLPNSDGYTDIYAWNEEALLSCLHQLPITWIGRGSDELAEGERELLLVFQIESGGFLWVDLIEDRLQVTGRTGTNLYRLEREPDWEQIWACLDFEAENPDPIPVVPTLDLWFDPDDPDSPTADRPISANYYIVSRMDDSGDRTPQGQNVSWGGIGGYACREVHMEFSYDPIDWSIYVEGLQNEEPLFVHPKESNDYRLELAPYSARYTVHGTFLSHRNTIYEMEFFFEVILPEEQ